MVYLMTDLDLDFLVPDLLLDLCSLELIGQLCLGLCCVDLLVKVGLLQLEGPGVVLDLGVRVVLDVHGGLLALGLAYSGVSVGLETISGKTIILRLI